MPFNNSYLLSVIIFSFIAISKYLIDHNIEKIHKTFYTIYNKLKKSLNIEFNQLDAILFSLIISFLIYRIVSTYQKIIILFIIFILIPGILFLIFFSFIANTEEEPKD